FRIPQRSSWGWDEVKRIQYRRIDSYLTESAITVDMHPGSKKKETTLSFHRPLQTYVNAFIKHGFVMTRMEEWISHKQSMKGPRQAAEDHSRKEIPLFLMIEGRVQ
ncbi:MAG: SAM-dependent methyltransferase, partial [Patescibacteria group bacterium]